MEDKKPHKIDHIGVAVKSLEHALPFYVDHLNMALEGIEEVESEMVKVAFLRVGESRIELLEPTSEESPVAKFIEKRGEGIHHIALGVHSINERIKDLKNDGIRMLNEQAKIGAGGAKIAFIHPKPASGVLYELCEKRATGEDK
ncbi:methylmalonyl-CoA epimerase [Pueribacillus theae]|uniref:Methylmalonyl-CoA epimerase n=1 Tax=Pueribacillus theae TaxID=2171751 RepID=A0A2U1K6M6_9BACI|nr:methylmalonyl-CoA epimerase [Pueribacillus theae]PWA13186.1 methylmalonyl-CoA epimerase [Pueribacillus theae]